MKLHSRKQHYNYVCDLPVKRAAGNVLRRLVLRNLLLPAGESALDMNRLYYSFI